MIFIPALINLKLKRLTCLNSKNILKEFSELHFLLLSNEYKNYNAVLPAFLRSSNVSNDVLKCEPSHKHGFRNGKYKMLFFVRRRFLFWIVSILCFISDFFLLHDLENKRLFNVLKISIFNYAT